MTTTLDGPGVVTSATRRLLAGSGFGGCDLAAHTALHGQCPPIEHANPVWAAWLSETIASSGLTGRGGAAFPSYRKHQLVAGSGRRSVLVVNAMEGEPLSVKDQVLLERSPHLVLDGAELVAAMLGSDQVTICIPDDRNQTAHVVQSAIGERSARTPARTPIEVLRPPARYVGGEESALASFVSGGAGLPAYRPDKGVPLAIGRRTALVHNAETLAHVALIARNGPRWFRQCGTDGAPGTTLVTVSGHVSRPGVHEIELGTPVSQLLGECGLGDGSAGVLVGGYGGAWLATANLDVRYTAAALAEAGAAIGVGILVPLTPDSCGVAETARIAEYMASESAGQCGPCVFGLPAIAGALSRLAAGEGGETTLRRIDDLCASVAGRGACRHPDGVIRLVRSALTVFAADARAHSAGQPCRYQRTPTIFPFPYR